jgi:hypothetical protein
MKPSTAIVRCSGMERLLMIEAEEADAAALQLPDHDSLAAFEAVFKIRSPDWSPVT